MMPRFLASRRGEGLLAALSLAVLAVCGYYGYLFLRVATFNGIVDPISWRVVKDLPGCERPADCLLEGDRVLSIDGVTHEQYLQARAETPIDWLGEVTFRVLRGDSELTIVVAPGEPAPSQLIAAVSLLLLPALFWLMGLVAVLFLRPRDERWLVLVLFFHVTAVLFAAGSLSSTLLAYSSVVLHVLTWIFCPLILHVHLILPTDAFPRARRWLPLFYAAAGAGIVLDLTRVLPPSAFLIAALTSMMLSLALLIRRLQLPAPPATRMANRLMLFGVGIGTVPWVAMLLVLTWFPLPDLLIQVDDFVIAVGGLLALPNWPLSYLYAMYKYEAGTIQLRANRLFGRYSFLSLYVIFFVVAYAVIGSRWPPMAEHPLFTSLIISLVFVALAPLLQKRFQLLLDRLVFGIRYQPEEVVGVFAERLPSAFDRASLRRLVCGEILPTLQIRQSALYLVQHERVECLYDQAVPRGGSVRSTAEIEVLLRRAERYIPVTGGEQRFAWVRLVIPLMVQDQPIGAWLLGRRDPDDFYPKSDVGLLHNLANQIATVLRAQIEILENRQLQKQLLHAQKMEAIGRLTAGISHDFNNILSAILGYSNLLRDHLHDDPRSQNYLDGILDAGKKAESLTKQLLSFSRRQAGDSQLVDVDATIRGMENLLRPLLAENIELILNLRAEHLIEADPIQIEQVILNLAVNAGDAMPGGGLLFIETSDFHRSSDESSADSRLAPGSYVRIQVRDTGTGMEPHVQQHIFEPFYTTKKEKGTGLGLATAYGIIHQCGGHIFADSLKGQGTTFHIYLPAAAAAERCAPQDERSAAALAAQDAGTILVAEDEEVVRSVVCEILRSRGYTVLQAPDGRAALELVEHHADPIDLLLTDVMMPHLRGDELAARLRDRRPEIKVIYMSGYTEQAVLSRSPGQDEVVLLQKPFMPDALVDAVRRVIGAGLRASGVR